MTTFSQVFGIYSKFKLLAALEYVNKIKSTFKYNVLTPFCCPHSAGSGLIPVKVGNNYFQSTLFDTYDFAHWYCEAIVWFGLERDLDRKSVLY